MARGTAGFASGATGLAFGNAGPPEEATIAVEKELPTLVMPLPPEAGETSRVRAWVYLVRLSLQRQARARQMVWIALVLLAFTGAVVALNTLGGRWGMHHWRSPRGSGPTYAQLVEVIGTAPGTPAGSAVRQAVAGACGALLRQSGFFVFAHWMVFNVFLSFLLPVWSLSFATEALGGERDGRTLPWLVTQPISRAGVYLAKFLGLLPYTLAFNVGGFAILCLLAGPSGRLAWRLFWPAVLWATLAFAALFHFMGACFRRPAVVAIVYSFFLETVLGNMPGYMKRVSVGFYARCMMFDTAGVYGLQPEKPSVFLPVDGRTALGVLIGVALCFLVVGMLFFSRQEYREAS